MRVELLRTVAGDQLRLDGVLHRTASTSELAVDVLVTLHGVGSNFYTSSLFERITPDLLNAGISVLWANTRGHDVAYTARVGMTAQRQGAAFEKVADCQLDIAAWLDTLRELGFERIGILGHSLGAIKALYHAAFSPSDLVHRLVAASPPRLSCSAFRAASQRSFFESLATAERCIEEGRPGELFEATFPFPMLMSAASYVDKYGPAENYNILKFAQQVQLPTLFTYGSRELEQGGIAFAGVPDALQQLPDPAGCRTLKLIEGADHNYTHGHQELSANIIDWLW